MVQTFTINYLGGLAEFPNADYLILKIDYEFRRLELSSLNEIAAINFEDVIRVVFDEDGSRIKQVAGEADAETGDWFPHEKKAEGRKKQSMIHLVYSAEGLIKVMIMHAGMKLFTAISAAASSPVPEQFNFQRPAPILKKVEKGLGCILLLVALICLGWYLFKKLMIPHFR